MMKKTLIIYLFLICFFARAQTFTVVKVFNGPAKISKSGKSLKAGDIIGLEAVKYATNKTVVACIVNTHTDEGTLALNNTYDPRGEISNTKFSILKFFDKVYHDFGHRSSTMISDSSDMVRFFNSFNEQRTTLLVIDSMKFKLNPKAFKDTINNKFYILYESNGEIQRKTLSYLAYDNTQQLFLKIDKSLFYIDGKTINFTDISNFTLFHFKVDDRSDTSYRIANFQMRFLTLESIRPEIQVIFKSSRSGYEDDMPIRLVNLLNYLRNYYGMIPDNDLKEKEKLFEKFN